nr:hypothetical protein [Tanacetum cinerariifolium]
FFIIAVQTPGSGISILLAVGTPSTGSRKLYCQWKLSPGSGNVLCILFPTVFNFVNALIMFIRILVIQKRVEDLQLGVKSYQKKINVTKPETTIPDIRKKDPCTPYQDP